MYGTGTRSYNRSTEARQMKKAQKEATEAFLRQPKKEVLLDGSMVNVSLWRTTCTPSTLNARDREFQTLVQESMRGHL
jgi:hypothetical protein